MMRQYFLAACVLLFVSACTSYATLVYTTEENVPLNQEYTDSLNGLLPGIYGNTVGSGDASYTTDATSSTDPAGHLIFTDNVQNTYVVWSDLSSIGTNLELRNISVWVAGGDENRNTINSTIMVVPVGGEGWVTVAEYRGFDPVANPGYNHALWQWDAGDVTNVSQLCVQFSWGPYGQQTRLVEIDGNFVSVPEPVTMGLLAMGSVFVIRRRK